LLVTLMLSGRTLHRQLDALLLGEAEAGHLGLDVIRLKRRIVLMTAILAGVAVSMAGIIGFVGLVAPHIARLMVGAGHRRLLPLAATTGALLLVLADTAARTIAVPAEFPLGVLTGLLGAPFFLWLLKRPFGATA
jgi:iron complex transport system permease protein